MSTDLPSSIPSGPAAIASGTTAAPFGGLPGEPSGALPGGRAGATRSPGRAGAGPWSGLPELAELPLADHHVHSVFRGDLDRAAFEEAITESGSPAPACTTQFDSQIGFAVRRWCAPVLDLDPHAPPDEYLARRNRLGHAEVNRRLLRASGSSEFLVDTGFGADLLESNARMAVLSGAVVREVTRLEPVAEELAASGVGAGEFADRYATALAEASAGSVGLKSIVAYRGGLDFDPAPPTPREVAEAAGQWLRTASGTGPNSRLDHPVLLRHVLWQGVERGLPIQFHTGYGDADVDLPRCDPLHLKGFIERVAPRGTPVMLLHCYPFHRHAGFLAQIYPHVYFDVGLGVNYVGARARAILAESLELAPFAKILFSSDAWGPAELHHLGALLWRRGMAAVLGDFVARDEWSRDEALRVARMIGRYNAVRVYGLEDVA
ncbi:amidohydrolase family protein [Streptomyces sp. NPDC050433]|uniref:amidohydrolase family protein n=1 Tax=Streptomyces sp. NPDC050433 TaxID=3365615 RepID=UPI0037B0002E